jgi:hypothetical protein
MIAGTYTKQPYEQVPLSVDFVFELLRDDDTILTSSVTAMNLLTQTNSGAEIFDGMPLIGDSIVLKNGVPIRANTRLMQRVQEGLAGDRHLITFRISTAAGHQWEGDVYLTISEP